MPSLYSLNSQSHPFWDFVASLDEGAPRNQTQSSAENNQTSTHGPVESSKQNAPNRQPTVEDEVVAESSSTSQEKAKAPEIAGQNIAEGQQVPFRGRGRCGREESAPHGPHDNRSGPCRGRRGGRGGFGEPHHHHHPPGEGFDGFGDFNPYAMHGHPFGGFGPFGPSHRGPRPCGPPAHHNAHRRRGPPNRPDNFNLGEFLSNLGSRLGLDLSGAAESLGIDRLVGDSPSAADGVDFEPRADIFDTTANYLIHLSLPGAKKEDLGVDWDGENSTLRVSGVVHRPGVDETTLKLLAVDGRKQEVGVFEKKIHLGTKKDPASIDIAAISAKMTDGILVVTVPKVEIEHKTREVPISGSTSPSPNRKEKQAQQAGSNEHADTITAPEPVTEKSEQTANEMDIDGRSDTEKGDEMQYDDPAEQLPEYKDPAQQDAVSSDEDEGDYVKIDVK